jgi:hypothetical protein
MGGFLVGSILFGCGCLACAGEADGKLSAVGVGWALREKLFLDVTRLALTGVCWCACEIWGAFKPSKLGCAFVRLMSKGEGICLI